MRERFGKRKIFSNIIVLALITSSLFGFIQFWNMFPTASAGSTWTQTSAKDFYNGTFDNTTIKGSGEGAQIKLDLTGLQTWTKKSTASRPGAGYSQGMATIWGTDKILVFGGWYYAGYAYNNETWVYDLSENSWTLKRPNNGPSARYYHATASIDGDDKVIIFGGYTGMGYLSDTWVYDLSDNIWTQKSPSKNPSGRIYHQMATIYGTDKVLLFGGLYSGYLDDTWVYDLSDDTWEEKSPTTKPQGMYGLYYHSMTGIWGTNKVLLFGGYYYYREETWIFDLVTGDWSKQITRGNPYYRYYSAMAPVWGTDQVILFGGYGYIYGYQYLNDTWVYDLSDNTWSIKEAKTSPKAGFYNSMASVYGTDRILLFGGYNPSATYWDETWLYRHNLPTKNGTYISNPHDAGANVTYKSLKWFAEIPINTSLRIQIRTASNESNLYNEEFVGPDGEVTSFYNMTPEKIWKGHEPDRWMQYIVYFNLNKFTYSPILKDISISYNCLPEVNVIGPIDGFSIQNNKPDFVWNFDDFDSLEQKGFQLVIDDDFYFDSIDFDSQIQNTKEERWVFPTGTSYNKLPDGKWYWKVRTKDKDGAWTDFSEPRLLTIDTRAPSSAPNVPNNNGCYKNLNTITGIATDSSIGSGIDKIELAIIRLTDNNYWDGSAWVPLKTWLEAWGTTDWRYTTSEVIWTSGVRYAIQTRAFDNTSNVEIPNSGNVFIIDMDRPVSEVKSPNDGVWLNKLKKISGISLDIGGSGVNKIELSILDTKTQNYWDGMGWNSEKSWLPVEGKDIWSYNTTEILWTTGTEYWIKSRALDYADNLELTEKATKFKFDAQKPKNMTIVINNDDEFTGSHDVDLSLFAYDFESMVSKMSFSSKGKEWSSWEPYEKTKEFEIPEDAKDGENKVYFRVIDNAGNIAEAIYDIIILDTTAPEELAIVINNGIEYTNSMTVSLSLYATDPLSGVTEMEFSYDAKFWILWEPYSKQRTFPLRGSDGQKTVYFRVKDKVGNIAEPVFDTIIVDTTPPDLITCTINRGDVMTNTTLVTLDIIANDNTSGIFRVSFSGDGENWTGWEQFAETIKYNLPPGDGKKSIFVKLMDNAYNIGNSVSDSIQLETLPIDSDSLPAKKSSESSIDYWFIFILIIIVLLILVIIELMLILRKKTHFDIESLPPGVYAIKPEALSGNVLNADMLSSTISTPQLIGATVTRETPQPIMATVQAPQLAKSTLTAQAQAQAQSQPGVAVVGGTQPTTQLPQLPPAKIQNVDNTEKTQQINANEPASVIANKPVSAVPSVATHNAEPKSPTIAQLENKPTPTVAIHLPNQVQKAPTPTIAKEEVNKPNTGTGSKVNIKDFMNKTKSNEEK